MLPETISRLSGLDTRGAYGYLPYEEHRFAGG